MEPVITDWGKFYNEDCINGARKFIGDDSVDLIITDPPYGINGDKLHQHYNRNEDFVVEGYVEIPEDFYGDFSKQWINEAERILKPGGCIYIVSGYTNLHHILNALKSTKLKEINHIIWKYNFGVYTSKKFVSSHYHILYYEKPGGKRTFNLESRFGSKEKAPDGGSSNYQDREDVWIINREYKPGQVKNKNELPSSLLIKMIQYSTNEGDLVCDFFLGGFSTAKVAIGLKRKAIGFEISESMFKARVPEILKIQAGYLIPKLRTPTRSERKNQGRIWTDEDITLLKRRYLELLEDGELKKDIILKLEKELGRGRFAIEKTIKILELPKIKKFGKKKTKDNKDKKNGQARLF